MEEEKPMEESFDQFLKLVADLASIKIDITDEDQAIQLLSGLPSAYEPLVHTLQYGTGKDTLTVNEVMTAAYSKELELKQKGVNTRGKQSEGLFTESRGRSSSRNDSGNNKQWNNRSKGSFRSKSRGKNGGRSDKTCWVCGSDSHWKRDCPEKKNTSQSFKPNNSANVASNLPGPIALTASLIVSDEEWVLDSGCTFHITPRKDLLTELVEFEGNKVMMGNNTHCTIKGMGKVTIDNEDGTSVTLSNVRYMPEMGRNLISYGQLEQSGCNYTGKGYMVHFYKEGRKVLTGKYNNGLYYLQGTIRRPEANSAKDCKDFTKRWHTRLAHMNIRSMRHLVSKGYLKKEEIGELGFCEGCVMGKAHKQKFPKAKHTTEGVLDYIHSDLWGSPNTVSSLSGAKYFLTFTDDYSKKVWIYFLKAKTEVFDYFAEWKLLMENQTGRKIKCIRTDNGLEFCNQKFDQLCKESGIKRHKTCPYTPQQNGISERMNRTIMDKVRSMLNETGLDESYWAEAASTAVYVINRSPSASIQFDIPEERWSDRSPDYSHLKSFGCVAYVHQVKEKTNSRAAKGIFIGYAQGTRGYRVWLIDEQKVVISKDVVFNEDQLFKDLEAEKSNSKKEQNERVTKKKVTFKSVLEDICEGETSDSGGATEEEEIQGLKSVEEDGSETSSALGQTDDLRNYVLARDRVRRTIKPPSKFEDGDFVAYALASSEDVEIEEPKSFHDAMKSKEWKLWNRAADEEMTSLDKNETWEYVERPKNHKVIGNRWIFKLKPGVPGTDQPPRYKGRLVAKGYAQIEGIDYNEVFAPVVKHVSIRLLLSAVVHHDLELEQLDVKTAFLHRVLKERVYMEQPEGYVKKGQEKMVCLLRKSLYGLKQSPREWNHRFHTFMVEQNYRRSEYDPCVYMKGTSIEDVVYLLLYVDDMLIAAKEMRTVRRLKDQLSQEFEMKDLGAARRILGMDIYRDRSKGTLVLSQNDYLSKVLKTFGMMDCRAVSTPLGSQFKLQSLSKADEEKQGRDMENVPYSSAVGSLMYAMVGSRPDLAYAVGLVCRFMSKPGTKHWLAVKWVMRYVKGALGVNLTFRKGEDMRVRGYCDSDYASDLDKSRSITGYVFTVGGNTVSWRSSLQKVVALSTTEAEYMALSDAVREGLWLKGICEEMKLSDDVVDIHCDSQSAIYLASNFVYREKTKHIRTKYNFIREVIADGEVRVIKIHTSVNPADMLTKTLPGEKFDGCLAKLGVLEA